LIDVSIATDTPDEPRAVLILGHGAGGDMNDALLRSVATALVSSGIEIVRFNFPYRELGRRAPGAQSQSEECYRAVATAARRNGVPLYVGGKSYGGRIATHIVAAGFPADGLVLLSYPLHPPGKPERIRDAHLYGIGVPMLFVQGSHDPFAQPDLLAAVLQRLGSRAELVSIEGGDHAFKVARGQRDPRLIGGALAEPVAEFVRRSVLGRG
jgi:predicted alpha/beta-hydrolase family hydrolase